ncbi:hypothetical protein VFPPC_17757 [Pochonia chlamydosporia 170]|uniref:Uncharacterized protein n=1 Tax=Pochonia chlamydosporia 170 TaxID=1380566 RepID=A0A219AQK6_METCM|nr:hypothetical protein VFPPC_17757 [Pochonia chlamydosporia 170]OWT43067.1 hypothetical protein VFPPC_17757 [Pochonia chlamydosporia 170]
MEESDEKGCIFQGEKLSSENWDEITYTQPGCSLCMTSKGEPPQVRDWNFWTVLTNPGIAGRFTADLFLSITRAAYFEWKWKANHHSSAWSVSPIIDIYRQADVEAAVNPFFGTRKPTLLSPAQSKVACHNIFYFLCMLQEISEKVFPLLPIGKSV